MTPSSADMPSGTTALQVEASRDPTSDARTICKTQPVIMIFDSKPRRSPKKLTKRSGKPSARTSPKTYAFIHTSRPGKTDEESRRLVKTHVMQNVLHRKIAGCSKLEVKAPARLGLSQDSCSMGNSPRAPPSYFLTYPIQIEPYMLTLIHDYAGAMLPTESKIKDSAWFPMVMTDAALFHALLSTSALFGPQDAIVQKKHMLESLKLISGRLLEHCVISEATITAILFMAKAEYFQGNYTAWGVHMDGVKRILDLRGGAGMMSSLIQQKIYSTDLLGCIEIGAVPRFSSDFPKPLCPPPPCDLPLAVISLAETYTMDWDLLALLSEINTYTTSSLAVREGSSLQYRLLSLHSKRHNQYSFPNCLTTYKMILNQPQQAQSDIVQELLLIGAFLFLLLPHNLKLPPIRPIDYGLLLDRLEKLSSLCFSDDHMLVHHSEVMLWLSFLGEVFSATSISLSSQVREHSQFRQQLKYMSVLLDVVSWGDMQKALGAMWTIHPTYEEPYQCLWQDVMSA